MCARRFASERLGGLRAARLQSDRNEVGVYAEDRGPIFCRDLSWHDSVIGYKPGTESMRPRCNSLFRTRPQKKKFAI